MKSFNNLPVSKLFVSRIKLAFGHFDVKGRQLIDFREIKTCHYFTHNSSPLSKKDEKLMNKEQEKWRNLSPMKNYASSFITMSRFSKVTQSQKVFVRKKSYL